MSYTVRFRKGFGRGSEEAETVQLLAEGQEGADSADAESASKRTIHDGALRVKACTPVSAPRAAMWVRRVMVAMTIVMVSLTPRVRGGSIDHTMWDECYEHNSPAPLIMPTGSQVTVPCAFLPHSWPMVSIRARFCQSEYGGYELKINATNGTAVDDDLTHRLINASWKFHDLAISHYVTLTMNISDNTTGMFDCVLRNATHGFLTSRFTIVTQIETLHRPGDPDCAPKLGFHADGKKIWSSEYNEWQRHQCGTFYGFDRLYYYLAASNQSNTKPPCPPSEPDRCWPVLQQYVLDGNCFRSQNFRREPPLPTEKTPVPIFVIDWQWVSLGLTMMVIGGVCLGLVLVVRCACGEMCRNRERFQKKMNAYRPMSTHFMRPPGYDELYSVADDEESDSGYFEKEDRSESYNDLVDENVYDEVAVPPLYSKIKRRL
nr:protein UL141 [synthetic construct]AXG22155.1 protein UL141 [synthetic construct]